jgi:hypothetical protein
MRSAVNDLLLVIESGLLFAGLLFFVAITQLFGLFTRQETQV